MNDSIFLLGVFLQLNEYSMKQLLLWIVLNVFIYTFLTTKLSVGQYLGVIYSNLVFANYRLYRYKTTSV